MLNISEIIAKVFETNGEPIEIHISDGVNACEFTGIVVLNTEIKALQFWQGRNAAYPAIQVSDLESIEIKNDTDWNPVTEKLVYRRYIEIKY